MKLLAKGENAVEALPNLWMKKDFSGIKTLEETTKEKI